MTFWGWFGVVVAAVTIIVLVSLLTMCSSAAREGGCGENRASSSSGCGRDSTADDSSSSGCTSSLNDSYDATAGQDETDAAPTVWYDVDAEAVWPLRDVFDEQTNVSLVDAGFEVRGLHWKTPREADPTWVEVYGGERQVPVRVVASYGTYESGTATIRVVSGQADYDRYLIAFPGCDGRSYLAPFMDHVRCPSRPTRVWSRSAPQVLGTYRRDATLFVVFSETMDKDATILAHEHVDLVFREGGRLLSVASDLNLADFRASLNGNVLAIAPITTTPFDLVVGPGVRAATGEALDVDRDGLADPGRPLVHHVYPTLLDLCRSRADYTYPCISEDDAAVSFHQFVAPLRVEVPVP